MNKFKNIYYGFLLAVPMLMMFTGCDKFLDRKPLRATLDDLNQGGLEGQIYAIYGAIRNGDIAGQAFGGIPWLAMHGFRSDDSEKGSSAADGADWGVIFDQFQYQKDHWSTTTYWDQHYTLIGLTNTALQIADSLDLNDPASEINKAEAKFFRAFCYFDMVRTYGEVPKIDFRTYNANDAKIPKSSVAEIYALIDQDLQDAIANLPTDWDNAAGQSRFPGRVTKYSAMALAAKTHLYRKEWATALGHAKQVIESGEFELYGDYFKLFMEEGENSKESLFEIQAYIGPNGTNNYSAGHAVQQGVRGSGEWDLGWGWNTPTEALVTSYEENDPRRDQTILYSGAPDGVFGRTLPPFPTLPRKYWNKKVYPEPSMQAATGNRQGGWMNQRVIRYADVLLMGAEAANEIGGPENEADAVKWINMIRKRARGTTTTLPDVTFTDKDTFRTVIKKERRAELAMEGERFFDLVRWNDALAVLGGSGYTNKHRFYPIPQAALDFNPQLVQNPEW